MSDSVSADRLPPMGCGTWAWGNRLLWNYDESMDSQLQAVFDRCVSSGVTLFDTGDSYGTGKLSGRSEQLLGQFRQAYQGANADRICLATKLAAYPWRFRSQMVAAGKASAERFGQIDLVQMHWSTANYAPWQEAPLLQGLADLHQLGLAQRVGLSNYGPKRLQWAHQLLGDRGVPVTSLQVQYSLLSTYPVTELNLKAVCDALNIQLIAYSPLALGLLTGKYALDRPLPSGIRGILFRQLLPKMRPLQQTLAAIAQSRQKTQSQVALNWCMAKGTVPIPGAKSIEQAAENLGALGWQLDAGEILELDRAAVQAKPVVQNIFQTR